VICPMRNDARLFCRAQAGDKGALDTLVEANLGLVKKVAWRMKNSYKNLEWDDCYQVGVIGLIKAVKNFDPARGTAFSTYAYPCIIGEIQRFLRKQNHLKVSQDLYSLGNQVKKIISRYRQENQKEPGIEELAKELDTSSERILQALEINQKPLSLEEEISKQKEEGKTYHQVIKGEELDIESINLLNVLEKMDVRSRYLLYLRHFQGYSQAETGKKMGLSQVHVSRLEKNIFGYLKENLRE